MIGYSRIYATITIPSPIDTKSNLLHSISSPYKERQWSFTFPGITCFPFKHKTSSNHSSLNPLKPQSAAIYCDCGIIEKSLITIIKLAIGIIIQICNCCLSFSVKQSIVEFGNESATISITILYNGDCSRLRNYWQ